MAQAEGALVALLGGLGEQLEHDLGEAAVESRGRARAAGLRRLGDVAIDPLDGVAGLEGQGASQHLVEGDAEGVQVGPLVEPAVHAARLLRRHVGERALDEAVVGELLGSAVGEGGDAEIGDLHLAGVGVVEQVLGLDVLVDDVVPVELGERGGEAEGEGEEALDRHRADRPVAIEQPVERAAAEVLQDQGHLVAERLDPVGLDDDRRIERPGDLELVLEPAEGAGAGVVAPQDLEHHRPAVLLAPRAVEDRVRTLVQHLQHAVTWTMGHRRIFETGASATCSRSNSVHCQKRCASSRANGGAFSRRLACGGAAVMHGGSEDGKGACPSRPVE